MIITMANAATDGPRGDDWMMDEDCWMSAPLLKDDCLFSAAMARSGGGGDLLTMPNDLCCFVDETGGVTVPAPTAFYHHQPQQHQVVVFDQDDQRQLRSYHQTYSAAASAAVLRNLTTTTNSVSSDIEIKSEPQDDSCSSHHAGTADYQMLYSSSHHHASSPSTSSSSSSSLAASPVIDTKPLSPSQDDTRSTRLLYTTAASAVGHLQTLLPPVSHFSQLINNRNDDYEKYIADGAELSPSPPSSERSSSVDLIYNNSSSNGGGGCFASRTRSKMHEMAIKQQLITDQDPRSNGYVTLSSEEKRTLIQEGYQLPTRLPLSKAEEEALKIVRRKIKNKLSAQESRRKRKEYMDTLEQRVQGYYNENASLRQKLKTLEQNNRGLLAQLKKLQQPTTIPTSTTSATVVDNQQLVCQ